MGGKKQMNNVNTPNAWLVVVNPAGQLIVNENYGEEDISDHLASLIEIDGGGYLPGGWTRPDDRNMLAIRTGSEIPCAIPGF